jgi:hypothetical protein
MPEQSCHVPQKRGGVTGGRDVGSRDAERGGVTGAHGTRARNAADTSVLHTHTHTHTHTHSHTHTHKGTHTHTHTTYIYTYHRRWGTSGLVGHAPMIGAI